MLLTLTACEVSTEAPPPAKGGFSARREARAVADPHEWFLGPMNAEREAAKLGPLVVSTTLNEAARIAADALSKGGPVDLGEATAAADGLALASLKVLRGEGSPSACIEGWKRGEGSEWQAVRGPYTMMGAAKAERADGSTVYCVVLGEPKSPTP